MPGPRNPVARSPLLRKGGAHQRARSGERQQDRLAVNQQLDDWLEDQEPTKDKTADKDTSPAPANGNDEEQMQYDSGD